MFACGSCVACVAWRVAYVVNHSKHLHRLLHYFLFPFFLPPFRFLEEAASPPGCAPTAAKPVMASHNAPRPAADSARARLPLSATASHPTGADATAASASIEACVWLAQHAAAVSSCLATKTPRVWLVCGNGYCWVRAHKAHHFVDLKLLLPHCRTHGVLCFITNRQQTTMQPDKRVRSAHHMSHVTWVSR